MTNIEYIQKATSKELADCISDILQCGDCFLADRCRRMVQTGLANGQRVGCRQVIKAWLEVTRWSEREEDE